MTELDKILELIPNERGEEIPWAALSNTVLAPYFEDMKKTEQSPRWHAEGNVWLHTQAVCRELLLGEFFERSKREREILFLSALLHDIGKCKTTVFENGDYTSPKHTAVGASMVRELLWRLGLSGSAEKTAFRESVAYLVRYHGTLPHIYKSPKSERKLIEIASLGELLPDFSLKMLEILTKADVKGRISEDEREYLEAVEYSSDLICELGISSSPYPFPDEITRYRYLSGKNISPDYPVYNDTVCEVIMLSGLPASGKDTFIGKRLSGYPVISLDAIRRELKVSPADREAQGRVASRAQSLARELLRKKQSFVFNATNITPEMRKRHLRLFEGYGAYTRIIYLETELGELYSRNASRREYVPTAVIDKMLSRLEPPTLGEACRVEWIFA